VSMPAARLRGIRLVEEREGTGAPASKGARVVYNLRIFLDKGEEVPLNERQVAHVPQSMVRNDDGRPFIDHAITLGRRQAIAGIEQALLGMKLGGYRKVRISPHLAYGEEGLPGLIPARAVLIAELWLREIIPE
jgi:hypothetical protein